MPLTKARQKQRGTRQQQGYGAAWQRVRKLVLLRDPVCRCEYGCERPSTTVDHIKPKSMGGTDDEGNLRGLCAPCHRRKSATEAIPSYTFGTRPRSRRKRYDAWLKRTSR